MGFNHTSKAYEVQEGGVTELVGKDEVVAQNEYSASVGVTVSAATAGISGEIVSVTLHSGETGSGAVLTPTGDLLFLDADPATTAGDAALTLAEHKTIFGKVTIAATDWTVADATGATATASVAIPFHALTDIYMVFQLTSATSINSAAGDDEALSANFWYRQEK